jgi:transcriptional regulator with XRE-family HTH domain
MSKTIHDDAYGQLLGWLKTERARRNREAGGFTMRALAPHLARLLGRPGLKFSWVAKVEQRDRRIDLLEYVAFCIALGVDPHEGLRLVVEHLSVKDGRLIYPNHSRKPTPCAAETVSGTGGPAPAKGRRRRRVE